jgi:hypothetical protein
MAQIFFIQSTGKKDCQPGLVLSLKNWGSGIVSAPAMRQKPGIFRVHFFKNGFY